MLPSVRGGIEARRGTYQGRMAPDALAIVASRHRDRDSRLRRLLALADIVGLGAAMVLTVALTSAVPGSLGLFALVATLPVWLVLFKAYGLYDRDVQRVNHATLDDVPWLFHALLTGGLATWACLQLLPLVAVDAEAFPLMGGIGFLLVLLGRAALRRATLKLTGPERLLFIGNDPTFSALWRKLRLHPDYKLTPVGFVSVTEEDRAAIPGPVIGTVDDVARVAAEHRIDRIMLSHSSANGHLAALLHLTKQLSLKVSVVPEMLDVLGPSMEVDSIEGVTVLGVNPPVLPRTSRLLKRGMDVSLAFAVLCIAAPLLAAIAILIKATSEGDVIFKQERIGRGGKSFTVYKFRTMVKNAEFEAETLQSQSLDPDWLLLEHDPRVTSVGRWLRSLSLDELPQVWNVLRGDMSMVGPRPLPIAEDARVLGYERVRLDLTPGITGYWQILGGAELAFREMVKLDYLYVTNWSLWTDVRLLLRTMPVVLGRRGAN